jgi:hypothetical protein
MTHGGPSAAIFEDGDGMLLRCTAMHAMETDPLALAV